MARLPDCLAAQRLSRDPIAIASLAFQQLLARYHSCSAPRFFGDCSVAICSVGRLLGFGGQIDPRRIGPMFGTYLAQNGVCAWRVTPLAYPSHIHLLVWRCATAFRFAPGASIFLPAPPTDLLFPNTATASSVRPFFASGPQFHAEEKNLGHVASHGVEGSFTLTTRANHSVGVGDVRRLIYLALTAQGRGGQSMVVRGGSGTSMSALG